MHIRIHDETPRFFGSARRPLYGVHHAPAAAGRRAGVVLCPAAPQESRQTHWAVRQLAIQLADAGVHALRFDYSGTGDSAGDDDAIDFDAWVTDARDAAAELRDVAGVRRVAFVGLRLGAAVAWRAAAAEASPGDLVLWEPVIDGAAYLAELEAAHQWTLREAVYPERIARLPGECLGFVVPPAMRDAVAAIDLLREPFGAAPRTLLVDAAQRASCAQLARRLTADGRAVRHATVADATFARVEQWGVNTFFYHASTAAIAGFVAGRVVSQAA